MSKPVQSADTSGNLDLEIHIPAMADGKCGCFFARKVTSYALAYDPLEQRFVAKDAKSVSEDEKVRTHQVFSDFLNNKAHLDPESYLIICKYIDFDADHPHIVKVAQVQKLNELFEAVKQDRIRRALHSSDKV